MHTKKSDNLNNIPFLACQRMNVFKIPYYFFEKSYTELIHQIESILKNHSLPEYLPNASFPGHFGEVTRLFFNFVSSATLLIDSTRTLIHDLHEFNIIIDDQEYNKKIQDTFNNPTCHLLKAMRNRFSHAKSILFELQIQVNGEKEVPNIFCSENETIALHKHLGSKTKEYLKSINNKIDIYELSQKYFFITTQFHTWLNQKIYTTFAIKFQWNKQSK